MSARKPTDAAPPATSLEVRERLVEALRIDLVGPGAGHALAEERLPGWVRPSTWYLTGFLVPAGTPPEKRADADEDEEFELVPESAGLAEESKEERRAAKKAFFPSSMGLSFSLLGRRASLRSRCAGATTGPRRSRAPTAGRSLSGSAGRGRLRSRWCSQA